MAMRVPFPDDDPEIPAEAPTAPTEEAWAHMTPAEREQAVEALLASVSQEEIDEREAMAEGDAHLDAKMGIRDSLREHFDRLGRRIYVGADIKVYYPGRKGFTPDVIAVADVDPGPRDCWMVSKEGKGVDLAFEVHYKGDRKKDFRTNVERFAAVGIPEYFIYDIRRAVLVGYRLPRRGAAYQPIPPRRARLPSEILGLDVALEEDRVRFYFGAAALVPSTETVTKLEHMLGSAVTRAQEESARADEQAARADEQAARADDQAARADQAALRLASAIITILTVRGVDVPPSARERILGTNETTVLDRWLGLAATASSVDALFAP
jgi:Uma2 family endonuclease